MTSILVGTVLPTPASPNLACLRVGHFLTGCTMKTKLMIDMSQVDEQAVGYALEYLLETVDEMRAEDLTLQEALLALGQAAAVIADKVTSETVH